MFRDIIKLVLMREGFRLRVPVWDRVTRDGIGGGRLALGRLRWSFLVALKGSESRLRGRVRVMQRGN